MFILFWSHLPNTTPWSPSLIRIFWCQINRQGQVRLFPNQSAFTAAAAAPCSHPRQSSRSAGRLMSVKTGVGSSFLWIYFFLLLHRWPRWTLAEMRWSDGARLWRRGDSAVLRHGDTGDRELHSTRPSNKWAEREKERSDWRTWPVRAAMPLPLSVVKIRHLAEWTTLTHQSNKL